MATTTTSITTQPTTTMTQANAGTNPTATLAAGQSVVVKLSETKPQDFNTQDPEFWFHVFETTCTGMGLLTEVEKFNRAIAIIRQDVLLEARDAVLKPHLTIPFQTLKSALISAFSKSRQAALIQLLDEESLGTRTPSQHLRHLKGLVTGVDDEILKARWFSHLPEQTRMCLAVDQATSSAEKLAEAADRIHEVFRPAATAAATVAAVAQSPRDAEIDALTHRLSRIESMLKGLQRGQSSSGKPRSRSSSRNRKVSSKSGVCHFHTKFGKDARNCRPGCKFQGNPGESR